MLITINRVSVHYCSYFFLCALHRYYRNENVFAQVMFENEITYKVTLMLLKLDIIRPIRT